MLYSRDWPNIVNQLYFNKKKIEEKNIKYIYNIIKKKKSECFRRDSRGAAGAQAQKEPTRPEGLSEEAET